MHEIEIDYLSLSKQYFESICIEEKHEPVAPTKFYNKGYEDALGVRRFFGNPNSSKALIIYSGRALHNYRVMGWSIKDRLENDLKHGAKIGRMDIAITDYIEEDIVTPCDVKDLFVEGKISGTLTKYDGLSISGQKVGAPSKIETFYIGSLKRRGRMGIFRAYDKGVELGLCADIIARLELEERGNNAHNSAKRIVEGASLQSVFASRLKFNSKRTERFFDGEAIDMSRGEAIMKNDDLEKLDRRWDWLLEQVAPALRKAIKDDIKHGVGNKRINKFLQLTGLTNE